MRRQSTDGGAPRASRLAALLASILLALAAGCGGDKGATAGAPTGKGGFEERAEALGITFRMEFLPGEQGAKFKINFYDHGCGVAAGDIDGDGDEDLYFLNQLVPNALYRNNGDGTFADVTADAITGFYFTSLLNLNARGVKDEDIDVMMYPKYGTNIYGNAIIVSDTFMKEKPEAVRGFLR